MAADYFVTTPRTRQQVLTLEAASRLAWRLLPGGAGEVEIRHLKTARDGWGPADGREGLLHRLVPAEHPVAPAGGYGSTSTFPPYAWRLLMAGDPEPAAEPAAEPEPPQHEEPQQLGFSFG